MGREALLPFVPLMDGSKQVLAQSMKQLRAVKDEQRRRDLSLHFLMLGGLRYNREDLLEMIVEKGMIPIEKFKESSFYQMIPDEGREEGREEGIAETLLLLIKSRFPKLHLEKQIKSIKDAEALKRLVIDVMNLPSEEALMKRIRAVSRQSTLPAQKATKRK